MHVSVKCRVPLSLSSGATAAATGTVVASHRTSWYSATDATCHVGSLRTAPTPLTRVPDTPKKQIHVAPALSLSSRPHITADKGDRFKQSNLKYPVRRRRCGSQATAAVRHDGRRASVARQLPRQRQERAHSQPRQVHQGSLAAVRPVDRRPRLRLRVRPRPRLG